MKTKVEKTKEKKPKKILTPEYIAIKKSVRFWAKIIIFSIIILGITLSILTYYNII